VRKKRDAAGTKARVLDAAERLFARKGFHGTSLAEISRSSGISDGLILYHFKSKEGLYGQVVEQISARYLGVLSGLRGTNLPPAEMLRASLKAVFDFWKRDRSYHRLSLWAFLEGRERASSSEARLTAGLAGYLEDLQRSGRFPGEIHPAVFLSMIIGPIHFWFRYKDRFAEILKLGASEEELDELFLEQLTSILARFFTPASRSGERTDSWS
jgi:TetR/AcrR family transcriptional regulator